MNNQLKILNSSHIIEKNTELIKHRINNIIFSIGATKNIQLDSGASRSVFCDEKLFEYIIPALHGEIVCASGVTIKVKGYGRVFGLRDVNYVPAAQVNLISEFDLYEEGYMLIPSEWPYKVFIHRNDYSCRWIFRGFYRQWLLYEKPPDKILL